MAGERNALASAVELLIKHFAKCRRTIVSLQFTSLSLSLSNSAAASDFPASVRTLASSSFYRSFQDDAQLPKRKNNWLFNGHYAADVHKSLHLNRSGNKEAKATSGGRKRRKRERERKKNSKAANKRAVKRNAIYFYKYCAVAINCFLAR